MITTALITEYNPFHLGHKYHLENSIKDCDSNITISIMSGNFMQRGNPALIDKWERAKIAVLNGVDLVIELPAIYALSSAEFFAFGAVSILNKLDLVDNLYFGSEHGDINLLNNISKIILNEPPEYKTSLKENLYKGLPFFKCRELALLNILKDEESIKVLSSSNNILGIEYLKALNKLNSNITPKTLKRVGNNYNDKHLSSSFSSATSIREAFKNNFSLSSIQENVSRETFLVFEELHNKNYNFTYEDSMFPYLKYKILTSKNLLNNIFDVSEGIENRIYESALSSKNMNELILNCKSKRYTYTRISRILSSFFIGLHEVNVDELLNSPPDYIRPLAFNRKGATILKEIKKTGSVDIIANVPKFHNHPHLNIDILATKAYSILNHSISPNEDYLRKPFILK